MVIKSNNWSNKHQDDVDVIWGGIWTKGSVDEKHLGVFTVSKNASYHKLLQSITAARIVFRIVLLLWNLADILAVVCQSTG